MPDIVSVVIWVLGGFTGGMAASDLLKVNDNLGPAVSMLTGVIGGVVGGFILQALSPLASSTLESIGLIIGQLIVAAASGAILTVIVGAVQTRWR